MKQLRSIMFALALCTIPASAALTAGGACEDAPLAHYNALGSDGCLLNGYLLTDFAFYVGSGGTTADGNVVVLSDGFRLVPLQGADYLNGRFNVTPGVPFTFNYLNGSGTYGPGTADTLQLEAAAPTLGIGTNTSITVPIDLGGGVMTSIASGDLSTMEPSAMLYLTARVFPFADGSTPPMFSEAEIRFDIASPEEVPEPATMSLLGLGLSGVFIARRGIAAVRTRK